MSLTQQQKQIIKATVPVLQQHGNEITETFYRNILEDNHGLNNIFNRGNQNNGRQAQALAGALYAYAANIDDLSPLAPVLERICQKHVSLQVTAPQYELVGQYLLAAMSKVLGDALTPDILDAWKTAYEQLADIMSGKEKAISEEQIRSTGWEGWRDFEIVGKDAESTTITSFYLKPVDGRPLPMFQPGQYLSVRTYIPELDYMQPRQYSLSDAFRSDRYRISVKRESGIDVHNLQAPACPGIFSNHLHDKKEIGDIVQVSQPAGDFFMDQTASNTDAPVVLISAGVGLTPMTSILNTIIARKDQRRVSWIHTSRNAQVEAFSDHLRKTIKAHPNVNSIVFHSAPTGTERQGIDYDVKGRLSLDLIDDDVHLMTHSTSTMYFVCGPGTFMTEVEAALKSKGVDGNRIKMEVFGVTR